MFLKIQKTVDSKFYFMVHYETCVFLYYGLHLWKFSRDICENNNLTSFLINKMQVMLVNIMQMLMFIIEFNVRGMTKEQPRHVK